MGCFGQRVVSRLRKANFSLCSALVRPHAAVLWPGLGSPAQKKHGYIGTTCAGQQRYCMYYTTPFTWAQAERAGPSLKKSQPRGDFVHIYKYPTVQDEDEGARLLSVGAGDRTRGNGHQLKHWRLPWNIRKHFCTVRVIEHWHKLLREVQGREARSPSLNDPGQPSQGGSAQEGLAGQDLQRFIPTSNILLY